jgi:hypothetical protein
MGPGGAQGMGLPGPMPHDVRYFHDADNPRPRRISVLLLQQRGFEPPHVHVEKGEGHAKYWLDPPQLAYSEGLTPSQLRRIRELVAEHAQLFSEAWHDHFNRP